MKNPREILSALTLEEKIRLLNGVGSWDTYDCNSKVPAFSMSDGPHGLRRQSGKEKYTNINDSNLATCFPTASAIASGWNKDAAFKMGKAIAKEAKKENVQIMLGCGMNIKRSPLCGRNFEYFSEDPFLSGKIASSYVKGMQEENVGACIKHYALNNQEKNRQTSSSNVDERTLREIYLKGFEIAVKEAKPFSIMTSYNLINGTYASANEHLLKELLRGQWDFDGIVISDWGANMNPSRSLKAGLDIGMPDSMGYFSKRLKEGLASGVIDESDLDSACERIISKALFFEEHKEEFEGGAKCSPVDYSQQYKIALDLALESAVLLKNDGMLPLKNKNKILVIGKFAKETRFQGGGSSHISTRKYPGIVEELSKDFEIEFEAEYNEQALSLVKKKSRENPEVPVLFFCGLPESSEGEGFDRADLQLPQEQVKLYKEILSLTKNVALVTFGGSPFDLSFAYEKDYEARAILHMYLCGEACASACAMLLTGKKNPSGKLAETWPLENKYIRPSEKHDINYEEGVLVGYRYYETKNIPVLYEFGFGLSYTSFEYSDLKVEKLEEKNSFKVSFSVQNIGDYEGSEVVQLYVKNPLCETKEISRSVIELRGFEKLNLEKGEKKTVSFVLTDDSFSLYSDKEDAFLSPAGTYEICVGSSVRKILLSEKVHVEGKSIEELVSKDSLLQEKVFVSHRRHEKGCFDETDSLSYMAEKSFFAKCLLKLLRFIVVLTSESKRKDDPAVKISLCGISENPLESFISTAPDVFNEKLVQFILRRANR